MPTATKANVRINSIHVIDSSVNTTSEPGSHAEWFMTFLVNGQSAQWSNEQVVDDGIYAVNRDFPNVDLGPNQMISIQATGFEQDSTSADDILPTLSFTLHPAEEFELGGTRWSGAAQSEEGSYNIEYTVMPAQEQALTTAREYIGVYRAGKGAHALWAGNWKSFTKKWEELSNAGLRLTRLSTFRQDTGLVTFGDSTARVFLGSFSPGTDGHALWVSEWPEFQAKWRELTENGLRLIDLVPYKEDGKRMFAGVFRAGTDAHALWVSEWDSFSQKWQELSQKGLRLIALDTYKEGGKRMFAGVYRAGNDGHALWAGVDWDSFQAKWKELSAAGLRLVDVASYPEGGKQVFAGVFRAGGDLHKLKRSVWSDFENDWQRLGKANYRLVSIDSFVPGQEE
jgi:Bacterial tandem repeat domain 1